MPNPKGTVENLKSFTTDRPESCTAQISIRIPPSLKAELKNLDNWQEDVRNFLAEKVKSKTA